MPTAARRRAARARPPGRPLGRRTRRRCAHPTGRSLPARASRDTRSMERRIVPAVSPFAATVGYSRAVRDGRHVYVAGTAPIYADGVDMPADAYSQAKRCLEIVVTALADVDARPEHVVRTRAYLLHAEDWEGVGRAHGEVFSHARPATTLVVVSGLLDPRWLVEIEVDALVPE